MIISSGYLFGKQISAGGTPPMPINVYFENGVFNPSLVPSGFNFNNNVATYYYRDDWARLIWDGDYHDDAVNGTVARLKINPSASQDEKWVLTNNSLQFVHTEDSETYENLGEVLFLPVVGWNPAYDYTVVEYNLVTGDGEAISAHMVYVNTYCYDDYIWGEGQYCYDICYGGSVDYPSALSSMSIRSINEDSIPVQSIDMIEIASEIISINKDFTVNITKIYGTNTDPNED